MWGRGLADGWELYANSIIKCYDQGVLDQALEASFSLKPTCPSKGAENHKLPYRILNSSSWGLRQPFQLATGREFSIKLKSKILAASDNSHRFQKGTTESEDNYQKNIYQDKVSKMEERRDITENWESRL